MRGSYFAGESFPEEAKPNVNFSMKDVANSEEMYQWMTHILLPGLFAADNGMVLLYNRPVGGLQVLIPLPNALHVILLPLPLVIN